jgi:c-di-GMP-related signal transduction protein
MDLALPRGTTLHERYIARQPIFDVRMKRFGYELLFRDGRKMLSLPPNTPAAA